MVSPALSSPRRNINVRLLVAVQVMPFEIMVWQCKFCQLTASSKGALLRHYRLQHGPFTHSHTIPCPHYNCPCSFKTHGALHTHK
ncbi:hypothetical protein UPYG_G00039730 [Umbra pygmaea]|uniref:C2H2-type domain-containing protein n=1 Tax=Umbra pygmaea TaxID=75934 RepID=A0ABD0Y3C0_UMBPY